MVLQSGAMASRTRVYNANKIFISVGLPRKKKKKKKKKIFGIEAYRAKQRLIKLLCTTLSLIELCQAG